jgi:anaerobic ribonucleoside-triphosphate reductase activating protein
VLKEKYLSGVTFSGGDPFQQPKPFAELALKLKKHNINIWAYTGYTFEELNKLVNSNSDIKTLLHNIDVLIDGKYVEKLADSTLKYRGSSNQRIIDIPSSLKTKKIKLFI